MAVSSKRSDEQVLSIAELRERVRMVWSVDYHSRGVALPSLIQDLHSSMASGREVAGLPKLAVRVHSSIVGGWLSVAGAPVDLKWQADMLARQAAEDLGDPTLLGVVAWGAAGTIFRSGAFDLARAELDSVVVPTNTSDGLQLGSMLALRRALVAAAESRRACARRSTPCGTTGQLLDGLRPRVGPRPPAGRRGDGVAKG